ncbi:unnamed protein product [Sphagnum jensenii]|uniref:mRNA capping enzyme adenylation domain-containing protein n=1 Tax=Sphagnum jensenii TaxID=128206 RepID=A0ABP0VAU5_9BRYO
MVNRRMDMYEVPVVALPDYFTSSGSVFDGELVLDTEGRQVYLVFDAIMVKSVSQLRKTFLERYNLYLDIFDTEHKDILQFNMSSVGQGSVGVGRDKESGC